MFGSAGSDLGAEGVDNVVDVRLCHWYAVLETVVGVVAVDVERLAGLEGSVRMPSFTILRVKSMVRARGMQVLAIVGVLAAGVPAASRLLIVALRWRLVRVEVAVARERCSSLARRRIPVRGLVGVADDG